MLKIKKEGIIIKPSQLKPLSDKFGIIGTTNPAAVRLPNNNIVLYVRVIEKLKNFKDDNFYYSPRFVGEDKLKIAIDKFKKEEINSSTSLDFSFKDGTKRLAYTSYLKRVILDKSGFKVISIEKNYSFPPLSWDGELGIEDARITKMKDLYVMTYVSLSKEANISTSIAISNDCKNWYRRGIIFEEQNKDVVIFPEQINNRYAALNRPEGNFEFTPPHIWLSYSKDLENWGRSSPFILAKRGEWDSERVGAGPPPIKTTHGWLLIYHGVIERKVKHRGLFGKIKNLLGKKRKIDSYCVGAALLDLKNPKKIISKSPHSIIMPKNKYEKLNFVDKEVIFPTGLVPDLNGKDLLLYSGGGDTVVTVKKIALNDVLKQMKR